MKELTEKDIKEIHQLKNQIQKASQAIYDRVGGFHAPEINILTLTELGKKSCRAHVEIVIRSEVTI